MSGTRDPWALKPSSAAPRARTRRGVITAFCAAGLLVAASHAEAVSPDLRLQRAVACKAFVDRIMPKLNAARRDRCKLAFGTGFNVSPKDWERSCLRNEAKAIATDEQAVDGLLARCKTAALQGPKETRTVRPTDIWNKPGGTGAGAVRTGQSLRAGEPEIRIDCAAQDPGWAQIRRGFVWGQDISPGCPK